MINGIICYIFSSKDIPLYNSVIASQASVLFGFVTNKTIIKVLQSFILISHSSKPSRFTLVFSIRLHFISNPGTIRPLDEIA